MNKLGIKGYGLLFALATLGAACANDAFVGEQDDEDDGGDGDADGDDEQNVPVDCPELPPAEGAPCTQDGASCEYDDCIEPISKATCTDGEWVVEADGCPSPWEETCPDSPPAAGDPCSPDAVSLGCTYDCESGLPADQGLEARCTSSGVFELNDDECQQEMGCEGPFPERRCNDRNDCDSDQLCVPDATDECIQLHCACNVETGEYECGGGCSLGRCELEESVCSAPYPGGCSDQHPCDEGFECVPPEQGECISSGCICDPSIGNWNGCLPDCGGHKCVPIDETACAGTNNPEGCSDTNPCPDGLSCMVPLEPVCLPSSCTCNAQGGWDCVEDCSGGECR
jgi:hypothetical protein